MSFFHLDQRPERQRCIAAHALTSGAAWLEVYQTLLRARLVHGVDARAAADVLLELRARGELDAYRRYIGRAIPARGHLRVGRARVALVAAIAAWSAVWWTSVTLGGLVTAAAFVVTGRWFVPSAPARAMAALARAARTAAARGDGAALSALLADVRRMIAEGRVPVGGGRSLVVVLQAAVDADTYPESLVEELRRLRDQAPEVAALPRDVERSIERRLAERRDRPAGSEAERRQLLAEFRRLQRAVFDDGDARQVAQLVSATHRASRWASSRNDARMLREVHFFGAGPVIRGGMIPPGAGASLAEVLRDRAAVEPFGLAIVGESDVLRAAEPDVDTALVGRIFDRLDARLEEVGNADALGYFADKLDQTVPIVRDPVIAARARRLVARARELATPRN